MNQPAPIQLPHQGGNGVVSQATRVEQSRAGAEVYAAVLAAKQLPRDESYARAGLMRACQTQRLANKAFFRLTRAGDQISGPSVHLAREAARCYGNFQCGVTELRRDDNTGESEMQAWAWDLERNARVSSTFIVKHYRDTRQGPKRLASGQDIYENNANAGARRLREAIFSLLPTDYIEEAIDTCMATLNRGDGKPLERRVADAVAVFSKIDVTEDQLAAKIGKPSSKWEGPDLGQLQVIYRSIERGETTKDAEFPPAETRVTAAEITAQPADTGELRPDDPDLKAVDQPEQAKAGEKASTAKGER